MENINEPNEAELLARIARGDEAAFSQFYDRLSGCLFSLALRILRNESAAEDVVQEVFVQIWERSATYRPELGKPLSWAGTMVRNKAIDHLRSSQRGQRLIDAALQEQASPASLGCPWDHTFIGSELSELMRGALVKLSPDYRQAIEMAYFSGFTQNEISLALGTPLGTVKARIRRGMVQLRETLEVHFTNGNDIFRQPEMRQATHKTYEP